jgi:hypothetical protein
MRISNPSSEDCQSRELTRLCDLEKAWTGYGMGDSSLGVDEACGSGKEISKQVRQMKTFNGKGVRRFARLFPIIGSGGRARRLDRQETSSKSNSQAVS